MGTVWHLFSTGFGPESPILAQFYVVLFYSIFIMDKQARFEVSYVASLTQSVFVNPFVPPSLYLAPLLPTPPSDSCHWQV